MYLSDRSGVVTPKHNEYTAGRPAPPDKAAREELVSHAPGMLVLDPIERDQLRELADGLTASPSATPERFCHESSLAAKRLPDSLWDRLRGFARAGSAEGLLVIEGLPVDEDLPATPPDNTKHVGETTVLARAQAVVNHALGDMVAYEAEGHGRLFQDMVPKRSAARTQTSLSSGVELELHTEQAFSLMRPDWVSLACLRDAPDAATYALAARDLVAALESGEVEMLREALWTTGVDASFRVSGHAFVHGDRRGPLAIIKGANEDPSIRFDQDLDWGISPEANALCARIVEVYPRLRRERVLKPGQMLLIDNHRVVHGRSPFTARFDGTDRFIVRSFVVRDLSRSRHARTADGRVIAARHS